MNKYEPMETEQDKINQRRFANRIEKRWASKGIELLDTEKGAILDLHIRQGKWHLGFIEIKHTKHFYGSFAFYFISKKKWDKLVNETLICNQKCYLCVSFACGTEAYCDVSIANDYGKIAYNGNPRNQVETDWEICVFVPLEYLKKFKGKVKPWNQN